MALFPIHSFFVLNDEIKPVSGFVPLENEGGIYEVLRVVQSIPLFLNEHLSRFRISAKIAGKAIPFSEEQIEFFIKELIVTNKRSEGNILISYKTNLKAFFIPHNYPKPFQYSEGVKCGVLKAERQNPNAKVLQTSVRQQANKLMEEHAYSEVLLVDYFGRITEGSRSNVFFVKKDQLVTPPANKVLLGITRQKTILCAKQNGIQLREKDVFFKNINQYNSVFITGTSPKILPLKNVGDTSFDPGNKIVQTLIQQYNFMEEEYIKNRLSQ